MRGMAIGVTLSALLLGGCGYYAKKEPPAADENVSSTATGSGKYDAYSKNVFVRGYAQSGHLFWHFNKDKNDIDTFHHLVDRKSNADAGTDGLLVFEIESKYYQIEITKNPQDRICTLYNGRYEDGGETTSYCDFFRNLHRGYLLDEAAMYTEDSNLFATEYVQDGMPIRVKMIRSSSVDTNLGGAFFVDTMAADANGSLEKLNDLIVQPLSLFGEMDTVYHFHYDDIAVRSIYEYTLRDDYKAVEVGQSVMNGYLSRFHDFNMTKAMTSTSASPASKKYVIGVLSKRLSSGKTASVFGVSPDYKAFSSIFEMILPKNIVSYRTLGYKLYWPDGPNETNSSFVDTAYVVGSNGGITGVEFLQEIGIDSSEWKQYYGVDK